MPLSLLHMRPLHRLLRKLQLHGGKQQLARAIPTKFESWARILLVDANARLGSIPSRAVDIHDEDEQDNNGEHFHNYLLANHL